MTVTVTVTVTVAELADVYTRTCNYMREMKQVSVLHMNALPRTFHTRHYKREALHHFVKINIP